MKGKWLSAASAFAAIALAGFYVGSVRVNGAHSEQHGAVTDASQEPRRVRSFSLIDSQGKPVTDQSFKGEWLIVLFGFTHCLDICPTEETNLARALDVMGKPAAQVRVAFITIDPDRDTPQVLNTFVQGFGPQFVGLTGTTEQIAAAEDAFGAYAEKPSKTPDGAEAIVHSSAFYVIDPNGRFRRQISGYSTAEDLTASLSSEMGLNTIR